MVVHLILNKPTDLIEELEIPEGSLVFHLFNYEFEKFEKDYNMRIIDLMKKNNIIDKNVDVYFLIYNTWDWRIDIYKLNKLIITIDVEYKNVMKETAISLFNGYSLFSYYYKKEFKNLKDESLNFFFINDGKLNYELFKFWYDYLKFKGVEKQLNKRNNIGKLFLNFGFYTSGYTLYGLYNQYKEVNSKFIKDLNSMINEAYVIMENLSEVINDMKFKSNPNVKEILYNYVLGHYLHLPDRVMYILGTKDYTDIKLLYKYGENYFSYLDLIQGKNLEEVLVKSFLYESLRDTNENLKVGNIFSDFFNNARRIIYDVDFVFSYNCLYNTYLKYYPPNVENLKYLENFINTINSEKFYKAFYEAYEIKERKELFHSDRLFNAFKEAYDEGYKQEIFEKRDKFYKSIGREIGL